MKAFQYDGRSHLEKRCFLDGEVGIARYDSVRHKKFDKLVKVQSGYYWQPEEVDLIRDPKDFKSLTPHEQHVFTSNLKRQILLDSVQGRAPSLALLPIVSIPELEVWIQTWTFFETIHSKSYTHIIKNVYPDPSKVLDDMMEVQEIVDCSRDISRYYDDLIEMNSRTGVDPKDHRRALWLCLNAIAALEGIRFFASFACSWNFAELKKMEGNAKVIKFIARDESVHLSAVQHMLKVVPKEDDLMARVAEESQDEVMAMFDAVVDQEHRWAEYLFKDGSMIGLNERLLCDYADERADKTLRSLGYQGRYGNKSKVLPWTAKWIGGSDVQPAPQEVAISSYVVGNIKRDVDEDSFKGFSL